MTCSPPLRIQDGLSPPAFQITQIRSGKRMEQSQFQGGEGLGKTQFEGCCPEGRAEGCHRGGPWDESRKNLGPIWVQRWLGKDEFESRSPGSDQH